MPGEFVADGNAVRMLGDELRKLLDLTAEPAYRVRYVCVRRFDDRVTLERSQESSAESVEGDRSIGQSVAARLEFTECEQDRVVQRCGRSRDESEGWSSGVIWRAGGDSIMDLV